MKPGETIKKGKFIKVCISLVVLGLLIWHAVSWHYNGMYLTMFQWITTDRTYLTVLYNLGLIIAISITLGILLGNITDIASSKFRNTGKPDKSGRDTTGL
jgi:hypothetical protein